jgi:Alpha-2-macroglobulin bait region domain
VTPRSDPIVFVSDTIDTLGKILKLDINVTDSMAPTSRIFVYYVRSDEEVVGGFLNFKVAGNRKNVGLFLCFLFLFFVFVFWKFLLNSSDFTFQAGVNLQVESLLQKDVDYVQPGEEVSFRVDTTPFALVGFMAVDQNLLLLKSGNDIQKSDVSVGWILSYFKLTSIFRVIAVGFCFE